MLHMPIFHGTAHPLAMTCLLKLPIIEKKILFCLGPDAMAPFLYEESVHLTGTPPHVGTLTCTLKHLRTVVPFWGAEKSYALAVKIVWVTCWQSYVGSAGSADDSI